MENISGGQLKYAFISDIHGNLEALDAVLGKIVGMGIKQVFCLGDIVGYGASPTDCIEVIRQKGIKCVMGNHEWAVLNRSTNGFNSIAGVSLWWTMDQMRGQDIEFLKSMDERHMLRVKNRRIVLAHGSPANPLWEYVYQENVNKKFISDNGAMAVGHTHIPFVQKIDGIVVINSGSVGQPRDRNADASFAVLDDEYFSAKIFRAEYDVKSAADRIRKAGLPDFLSQRLHLGI
jgi:putative phosphoesterase